MARWAADAVEHDQVAMYAYRRANVAQLHREGREVWRSLGRLDDHELVAPDGARYAVGHRVVTLAPGASGRVVTSETGTVVRIDALGGSLSVRMDDDSEIRRLAGQEIAHARLAHGYAVTVHRSQGSSVERAHALEDGGGRELAYVKMSRAKQRSTVYVVADSIEQATEDLRREWGTDRRLSWVIDAGKTIGHPTAVEASASVTRRMRDGLYRARLVAERDAILAVMPPDPSAAISAIEQHRRQIERDRANLATGEGRYRDHPVAQALCELRQAEGNRARLERNISAHGASWKDRHHWRAELRDWKPRAAAAARRVADLSGPELASLHKEDGNLASRLEDHHAERAALDRWAVLHPEALRRVANLNAEINSLERTGEAFSHSNDRSPRPWSATPAIAIEQDLGLDIGW